MHDTTNELEAIWDIPVAPTIKVQRPSKYGGVRGLEDNELAGPEEMERMVEWELWGPVLRLPESRHGDRTWTEVYGTIAEQRARLGQVGPAAANSRTAPRARTLGQLRVELRLALQFLAKAHERVPGNAKYAVLNCVRMGIIDLRHIVHQDLVAVAVLDRRTRHLCKLIAEQEQQTPGEESIPCTVRGCDLREWLD